MARLKNGIVSEIMVKISPPFDGRGLRGRVKYQAFVLITPT
ncbi:MAG: hypothetical protein AABZ15_05955 [Nitrospirota bacterium]